MESSVLISKLKFMKEREKVRSGFKTRNFTALDIPHQLSDSKDRV